MPLTLPSDPSPGPTNPATTSSPTPSTAAPPKHHTLTLPLPQTPHTTLNISLTSSTHYLQIFLTTSTPTSTRPAPLGSFVYALPNRFEPAEPLCTALYSVSGSVEFATRVAKIVCKRLAHPRGAHPAQAKGVYVGCSVELGGAGARMEEEGDGLRVAVEGIMGSLARETREVDGEGKGGG